MRSLLLVFLSLCFCHVYAYDLVVAKDGSGDFTTVQDAINAAPAGSSAAYSIYIKNGTYKEKITVPSNKTFIQLIGESVANTIITYDDYAGKYTSCSATLGTQNSAGFSINANDFTALNVTFINSYGDGSQAVTVLVNADRAVFKNCRFLGNQDTLYLKGSGTPRCYFNSCYIDGNIDFIFGSAVALFDSCVVYAKTRPATGSSYITAPNTPTGQAYGFVFRNCRLPDNTGGTLYYLSRPWPSPSESATAQKAVFINATMSGHIQPAGWSTWNASTITGNIFYGEYNSRFFDGTAMDVSARVPWSYQLSQTDADAYTTANIFGGWDPCTASAEICNGTQAAIAVSNFSVSQNLSSSAFSWNISWPMNGIAYTLYRSSDNINFSPVYNSTATDDTAVNFQYTDLSVPTSGNTYYYYVEASRPGYATQYTDTIAVARTASLKVNAPASLYFCGFNQVLGTPSASQSYTISGSDLTAAVSVTPPAEFEVSLDGNTWYSNASPLTINPVSGSIATTTVNVRLNATAVGIYTGDIINLAAGANSIAVAVKGKTTPPSTSDLLQAWALTGNANDSVEVRSDAVTQSTASLVNLFTTDGSLPAPAGTVPAYSNQYGQVLGANAAGNNWQNVGGTLKRTYYEQFTVTAKPGAALRIDSVTFFSNFYGTQSSTKMALVYSVNGFSSPADSTEFSDGVGPTGSVLSLTGSGTFSKSFPVAQNNAGPSDYYALALNGTDGVVLNAGQTITIRLYWACSSTGTPRFAMLKNVGIKGVVITPVPLSLVYFTAVYFDGKTRLSWNTENEIAVDGFEVERSIDGTSFMSIANVRARNAAGQNNYEFFDNDGITGTLYYRIKIKNANGDYRYSNVNIVSARKADRLKIVPNLVVDNINVFHSKAKAGAIIEVYASDGRKMLGFPVLKDAMQTHLNAGNMPAGVYNLVYVNNNRVEYVKFVKQ